MNCSGRGLIRTAFGTSAPAVRPSYSQWAGWPSGAGPSSGRSPPPVNAMRGLVGHVPDLVATHFPDGKVYFNRAWVIFGSDVWRIETFVIEGKGDRFRFTGLTF